MPSKVNDPMTAEKFRKELQNIMPGYKWTIRRGSRIYRCPEITSFGATGIQSAGFNRISTLEVIYRKKDGKVEYEVKSSGFGVKAPWGHECTRETLARALRGLQDHYENQSCHYGRLASDLEAGRKKSEDINGKK